MHIPDKKLLFRLPFNDSQQLQWRLMTDMEVGILDPAYTVENARAW